MQPSTMFRLMKKQALDWNLFESPESRSDTRQLRIEIVSTRIYVLMLTLLTVNLIIYASLITLTKTITITKPSQATYTALNEKYSNALSCPCENIAVIYGEFIKISVQYHPICTSWFITDAWINVLVNSSMNSRDSNAPSVSALNYFELLGAFCATARRTIQSSIDDLFSDVHVTKHLLSAGFLQSHSEVETSFKLNASAHRIQRRNALLRSTSHSNQFQTMYQTPERIQIDSFESGSYSGGPLYFEPRTIALDGNAFCNCVEQLTCSSRAVFYNGDQIEYV